MATLLLSPLSPTARWYMDGAWSMGLWSGFASHRAIKHTIILGILWLLRRKIKNGIRNMIFGFAPGRMYKWSRFLCVIARSRCSKGFPVPPTPLTTSTSFLYAHQQNHICRKLKHRRPAFTNKSKTLGLRFEFFANSPSFSISYSLSHSRSLLAWTFLLFAFWWISRIRYTASYHTHTLLVRVCVRTRISQQQKEFPPRKMEMITNNEGKRVVAEQRWQS